jgi:outer membrane protein assembly factor BamB
MLVATESGSVIAFDATGVKMWEVIVGGQIYASPVATGDLIVVAPLNADFLLAGVSKDGKLLWKFTGK